MALTSAEQDNTSDGGYGLGVIAAKDLRAKGDDGELDFLQVFRFEVRERTGNSPLDAAKCPLEIGQSDVTSLAQTLYFALGNLEDIDDGLRRDTQGVVYHFGQLNASSCIESNTRGLGRYLLEQVQYWFGL